MAHSFQEAIPKLSDSQLTEYITNHKKYMFEAVQCAVVELRKRGQQISDTELEQMRQAIAQRDQQREVARQADSPFIDWKRNVTVDPNAPLLYSERAIYGFSFLFSVVFGAVLLVLNLRELKKPEAVVPTISFALAYLGTIWFTFPIIESALNSSELSWLGTYLGAWLILKLVWNKYIGKETKYRKRSITIPVIIAAVIAVLFMLVIFLGTHAHGTA